jgi:serine/threonine-protein kinase
LGFKRFAILLLKYGLLVVALGITAVVSALTTMRVVLRSQEVTVPALVGKRVPEAGVLASRQKLSLRVEGRRNDPKVPAEHVVEQDPPSGATLKTQRSIRVWVSLGPRRLEVPAVIGESLRGARLSLEQAGVPVGRVLEARDAAEEGTVLQQHPSPGPTEELAESGAALLVSRGPAREYVMPDLIGRRAGPVMEALKRAGLKVGDVRQRAYPGVEGGIILRQVPASGYRVNPNTAIVLDVSQAQ